MGGGGSGGTGGPCNVSVHVSADLPVAAADPAARVAGSVAVSRVAFATGAATRVATRAFDFGPTAGGVVFSMQASAFFDAPECGGDRRGCYLLAEAEATATGTAPAPTSGGSDAPFASRARLLRPGGLVNVSLPPAQVTATLRGSTSNSTGIEFCVATNATVPFAVFQLAGNRSGGGGGIEGGRFSDNLLWLRPPPAPPACLTFAGAGAPFSAGAFAEQLRLVAVNEPLTFNVKIEEE